MGRLRDLIDSPVEFEPGRGVLEDLLECRFLALDPVDYGRNHLAGLMARAESQPAPKQSVDVMPEKVAPLGPQVFPMAIQQERQLPTGDDERAVRLAEAHEALERSFREAA